jgi:hypothetical protein
MLSASAKAAAYAALFAGVAGLAAGWTLNGWRLGAKVERLEGTVATQRQALAALDGANQRCVAGIAEVKGAVQQLVDDARRRAAAAAAAMARAEKQAAGHLAAARHALGRPMPEPGLECEQTAAEAAAYARRRKAAP